MLDRHMELMWAGALGAIPIAVIVGVVCRLFVRRPATRHAMWVMVLAAMFMPAAWWSASEGLSVLEPHAQARGRGDLIDPGARGRCVHGGCAPVAGRC